MKTLKIFKYFFVFFFLLSAMLQAQTMLNTRGLLMPIENDSIYSEKYCCILLPQEGFRLYDKPHGKRTGTLIRKNDEYSAYLLDDKKQTKLELETFACVGYEILAIEYIGISDGFVKILYNNGEYWLSLEEIQISGFKVIPWMDFLIQESHRVLGYYANEPGLRLRKTPDTNGEIIGSARGDLYKIELSNEVQGNWCKVTVIKYHVHPCFTNLPEEEIIEYKIEGWMKVIDDNGTPNLWHYAKGC
jgi:hypothetical protein